mgnify:CR=1 FL=1
MKKRGKDALMRVQRHGPSTEAACAEGKDAPLLVQWCWPSTEAACVECNGVRTRRCASSGVGSLLSLLVLNATG